uniref:Uncharacterized protein n=1 Tax=Anguilla anguilla TaxID=7936 RepID=A0A0E9W587_ANGAN
MNTHKECSFLQYVFTFAFKVTLFNHSSIYYFLKLPTLSML